LCQLLHPFLGHFLASIRINQAGQPVLAVATLIVRFVPLVISLRSLTCLAISAIGTSVVILIPKRFFKFLLLLRYKHHFLLYLFISFYLIPLILDLNRFKRAESRVCTEKSNTLRAIGLPIDEFNGRLISLRRAIVLSQKLHLLTPLLLLVQAFDYLTHLTPNHFMGHQL